MGDTPRRTTKTSVIHQLNPSGNISKTAARNPFRTRLGIPPLAEEECLGVPNLRRRDFMKLCGTTAALLGLGAAGIPRIADALVTAAAERPSVVWLNFASDTGCTEALIKATYPNAAQLILEILSLDYNETIMAAAGTQAEEILEGALKRGDYILFIEGAIPTKKGYGMIARREMIDIGKEFADRAKAVIAVGSCATWGGVPAGDPNPAGLKGVREALGVPAINLDLCPVNEGILVATIVDFLVTNRVPELDGEGRPKIFYGQTIHDQCERRGHFNAGRFVEQFGSKEEELGYCLYKMGCKGPVTHQNCPNVGWNEGTNWPIGCGHPCIGCAEPDFWDKMTPFYRHLAGVPGFGVHSNADRIGIWATAGVAAAYAAHGLVQIGRRWAHGREEAAARAEVEADKGADAAKGDS